MPAHELWLRLRRICLEYSVDARDVLTAFDRFHSGELDEDAFVEAIESIGERSSAFAPPPPHSSYPAPRTQVLASQWKNGV